MADDFIRFKSTSGEVFISKSSISSIKQKRTNHHKTFEGDKLVDKNYNYIEITLKELDAEGHNVTIDVNSELDAFLSTYFK